MLLLSYSWQDCYLPGAEKSGCGPPWDGPDNQPIMRPDTQRVSELHAIVYNTWLRHFSLEYKTVGTRDRGALNVNAWDEAPASSWFTNRIGRQPMNFDELLRSLGAIPPALVPWTVEGVETEGYTPKL